MEKWLDNYNNSKVTTGPGFVGQGYNTKGRNYSPAWGGQFQDGGILGKTFLQPNSPKLPAGPTPGGKKGQTSTELAMSIGGGKGEPAYLIPTFKYGKPLKDPEAEFRQTGEHLGGPFKTWQAAEKFGKERHKYVEQGKPIPAPLRISDEFAMGGNIPGAVGFTYARTQNPAPSNGKYAKKTKASAQNGKKLYGATNEEEKSVQDFVKSYYASDRFKENLYDKGNAGIKDKSAQVSKDVINKINNLSYTYNPSLDTGFDKGSTINMGNPNAYLNAPKDLALAHEMFHPMENEILSSQPRNVMMMLNRNTSKNRKGDANALYEDMLSPMPTNIDGTPQYPSVGDWRQSKIKKFASDEQDLSSTSMHDDLIGEVRADIMALRYLANKKGIWDVTKSGVKDMTPEMLNQLYKSPELNKQMYKSDSSGKTIYLPSEKSKAPGNLKGVDAPKNPGLMLDRLKQRYSDKDLLYLMNKLAYKNNNQNQTIAQNGGEMKFYQEGLDFKPKTISQDGAIIDPMGQWAHPGEVTIIPSNEITMKGVDYPVLGVSDTGDEQMMYPGEDYKFDGNSVTEYPILKKGGWLNKYK